MRPPLLAALLAAGAVLPGCRAASPERPRLVLLYATCTLNRSYVSPYGNDVRYTPNLAAFAKESVVFLRHHTETEQSGPAFASLLSGTQVDRHRVFRHPARLPDGLLLAAEAFAKRGYETHFWSGHPMAAAELNYDQGVQPHNVRRRVPGVANLYELTANDGEFEAILARLKRNPALRAYVQVVFTVTHGPYTPVDPRAVAAFRREHAQDWPAMSDDEVRRLAAFYEANYLRLQWDFPSVAREHGLHPADIAKLASVLEAYYRVSVSVLDHCFGRVVDKIRAAGLLEESLIAFTADHGETLYRADALFKWTHGLELAPDAVQVPLLVRLPGGKRAGAYGGVSRSIDVFPTLAGLSGFTVGEQDGVSGEDLSAAVLGRTAPPALRAFSHTTLLDAALETQFQGWLASRYHTSTEPADMWVSVRDGDLYARLRKLEPDRWGTDLLDMSQVGTPKVAFDPQNRRHRDLARELEAYKAHLLASYGRPGSEPALDQREAIERLRALGYVK
jgi:arylsulfatase A-like enzyme